MVNKVKSLEALVVGIHSHIGSQISEPKYYLNLVETLFDSLITLREERILFYKK